MCCGSAYFFLPSLQSGRRLQPRSALHPARHQRLRLPGLRLAAHIPCHAQRQYRPSMETQCLYLLRNTRRTVLSACGKPRRSAVAPLATHRHTSRDNNSHNSRHNRLVDIQKYRLAEQAQSLLITFLGKVTKNRVYSCKFLPSN